MMAFKEISKAEWPHTPEGLNRVFLNDEYLVQEYIVPTGHIRLTINSTRRTGRKWVDQIPWDTLQHIKRMVGHADKCAVEIYPPDQHVVNVANMRHLWITDMPDFAWKNEEVDHGLQD